MRKGCVIILVLMLITCLSVAILSSPSFAKEQVVVYLSLADYTGPIAGLNVRGLHQRDKCQRRG